MKHRLADLLSCPGCGSFPLELTVLDTKTAPGPELKETRCAVFCSWRGERLSSDAPETRPCSECYGVEITEGMLHCRDCGREFPVIDGVPRFNPDVEGDYPAFFARRKAVGRAPESAAADRSLALDSETKRSFGYQWLRYRVTSHEENRDHFYRRTATERGSLGNKLFFEAGCGMGRYLKVIADEPPAEAVGLDLSLAVNRAYRETRGSPFIHIVQGDILRLPLRPASFDHVYSIGVLHHTPSTERAFRAVAKLVKPSGRLSVWVYHVWRAPGSKGLKAIHAGIRGAVADGLRRIATRLPHPLLHLLCHAAVPLGWAQRQISRAPVPVKLLLSPLSLIPCSPHPDWRIRLLDTFDWYSPRYQWKHTVEEVAGWFRDEGFEEISTEGFPVSVRGRRPAS